MIELPCTFTSEMLVTSPDKMKQSGQSSMVFSDEFVELFTSPPKPSNVVLMAKSYAAEIEEMAKRKDGTGPVYWLPSHHRPILAEEAGAVELVCQELTRLGVRVDVCVRSGYMMLTSCRTVTFKDSFKETSGSGTVDFEHEILIYVKTAPRKEALRLCTT